MGTPEGPATARRIGNDEIPTATNSSMETNEPNRDYANPSLETQISKLGLTPTTAYRRPNVTVKEKFSLKGDVNIGTYDFGTVFIDVFNEVDCKTIWFKRSIEVDGMVMWLQKWTPDIKPEEDSSIIPATLYLYKQGLAKARVEVDLTKPQIKAIWIGIEEPENLLKGFVQKLDYEGVPKYCRHCNLLGHSIHQCRALEKEKELSKEKESKNNMENVSNNGISENVKTGNVSLSNDRNNSKNRVPNESVKNGNNESHKNAHKNENDVPNKPIIAKKSVAETENSKYTNTEAESSRDRDAMNNQQKKNKNKQIEEQSEAAGEQGSSWKLKITKQRNK
ncbi:hypothetical protein RND71_016425 [Anisodus tanguticus]|uniref:DUF4283 domain-containing protein n=1 Tax=Anisodus tanguticus TaxID=243964 RepID=A0AAE1S8H9_9SOLA|nr:hypothetical protein RND71_016425 [Anisodus tanguticus]